MDKQVIRQGLREELQRITQATGYDAITIPKKDSIKCTFATTTRKGDIRIPFEDLLDIMNFALENTIFTDFRGQLWRQDKGIPMGDPHSPGMTIGSCAWMEHNWLTSLTEHTKANFLAKRYMDDILLFYVERSDFDHRTFIENFAKSDCYKDPLRLEDGGEQTFLETTFEVTPQNTIRHWLKNENQPGQAPKIWRYAHYNSHGEHSQKEAVLLSTLRKLHNMASDPYARTNSAYAKLMEFHNIKYPHRVLWRACTKMAITTRDITWFRIRDKLQ